MVWAGMCATEKTSLVFVKKGAKIDSEVYQEEIFAKNLLPEPKNTSPTRLGVPAGLGTGARIQVDDELHGGPHPLNLGQVSLALKLAEFESDGSIWSILEEKAEDDTPSWRTSSAICWLPEKKSAWKHSRRSSRIPRSVFRPVSTLEVVISS